MKLSLPHNSIRLTEVSKAIHCAVLLSQHPEIDSLKYNMLVEEIVNEHLTKEQLITRHVAMTVAAAFIVTKLSASTTKTIISDAS